MSAALRRLWSRTPFWEWTMCPPWGLLDGIGHAVHAPERIQRPLCDRFDEALGMEMEPE